MNTPNRPQVGAFCRFRHAGVTGVGRIEATSDHSVTVYTNRDAVTVHLDDLIEVVAPELVENFFDELLRELRHRFDPSSLPPGTALSAISLAMVGQELPLAPSRCLPKGLTALAEAVIRSWKTTPGLGQVDSALGEALLFG